MKGFGQPKYWLQIAYRDDLPEHLQGADKWIPLRSGSRRKARDRAAISVQDPFVDYVLILDGSVQRGAVAELDQILDEFQAYDVPGARRYHPISTKQKKLNRKIGSTGHCPSSWMRSHRLHQQRAWQTSDQLRRTVDRLSGFELACRSADGRHQTDAIAP